MTNDKLPEEMQEQISKDADEYARTFSGTRSIKRPYIEGATAWAIWKVRCDELQDQAKRMADALEAWIKADDKLTVAINAGHVHYAAEYQGEVEKCMGVLKEQVQQFKDGTKGKEVGKEPKPEGWPWVCEFCGKQDCGSDHK